MAGNTAYPNGITANVVGDVTGDLTGAVQQTVEAKTASGTVTTASKAVLLGSGTVVVEATLGIPTATTHDGVAITFVATTAQAHTVTCATAGFNAGNAGGDVATFGGAIGDSFTVLAYQGEWYTTSVINVTFA